jgi:hypothetical protein
MRYVSTVITLGYEMEGRGIVFRVEAGERGSKGTRHPKTDHTGPGGKLRYSSTLSLTSALEGVDDQRDAPAASMLVKRPSTHCTEGWV